MRIQYASDLHLEFEQNRKYLAKNPLIISGEVLILAGDIVPLLDPYLTDAFFSYVSQHYKKVFWVPGNHEFYHNDLSGYSSSYNIPIRPNVHIVHNCEIVFNNIQFIFSTLWSKISKKNEQLIEQSVADFHCITRKGRKIKTRDFNQLHAESLGFIKQSLAASTLPSVVVSHHLPSRLCNSERHQSSPINEAFCVDLTSFITSCNANFWIYGHSHFNQKPLIIGNTMLLTNQLGYVANNEQGSFKTNAYFAI